AGRARALERIHQGKRARIRGDSLAPEYSKKRTVLPVADTAHGVGRRRIRWLAPGQLNVAATQQRGDTVVALLAVDVRVVVVVGVRRLDLPCAEELIEHGLPCAHMHFGGWRDHAIEVKEN